MWRTKEKKGTENLRLFPSQNLSSRPQLLQEGLKPFLLQDWWPEHILHLWPSSCSAVPGTACGSGSRSAGNFVFPKVCLVTNTLGTPSFLITFRALLQITLNVFSFKAKRYFFSSLNLKKKHFPSKRVWEWLLEISF